MSILSIEPVNPIVIEFRIYIQMDAEQSDVRPPGLGDLYVDLTTDIGDLTDHNPTVYDRADDR